MKIISGGQTGVDRAALDVALKHGIECGGWCPAGRLDELGRIPDQYPVHELEAGGFAERTSQNVKDSDGTVVIYPGTLYGGTEQTVRFCQELKRPHELIDASKLAIEDATKFIKEFVRNNKISILNIAGPRQSEWPEGYDYACRAIEALLRLQAAFVSSAEADTDARRGERLYSATRSAKPSPDRGAPRNKRGSAPRANKSRTR